MNPYSAAKSLKLTVAHRVAPLNFAIEHREYFEEQWGQVPNRNKVHRHEGVNGHVCRRWVNNDPDWHKCGGAYRTFHDGKVHHIVYGVFC